MTFRPWRERIRLPDDADDLLASCFVDALTERLGNVKLTVSAPRTIELALPDGAAARISLDNLAARLRNARGDERVAAVDEYVAAVAESAAQLLGSSDEAEPSAANVVPLVRDAQFIAQLPRGSSGSEIFAEQLVADFVVVYAFDLPRTLRYASREDLERVGLDPGPTLRSQALANLSARLGNIEDRGDDRVGMLTVGGTFESSLLLIDELWQQLEPTLAGSLVVSVPSRDVVLYTGTGVPGGLEAMIGLRDRVLNGGDHLLTSTLLRREGSTWAAHEPMH
jgi:uncharacterized protein YtpQ (UPF0354 family)